MLNITKTSIRKTSVRILHFLRKLKNNRNNVNRRHAPVQLHDFVLFGATFFETPHDVVDHLRALPANPLLMPGDIYPKFYDSNPRTLELLRILVKEVRPEVVIETGVANGASTRTFLSSFKDFDLIDSKLFSLDIDPRVATPELLSSPQFNFVLIDSPDDFLTAMEAIKVVDFFYHDSDHSYKNQMLEYIAAWEILNPDKGVLVSDDINWSNAFLDFCKKVNRVPLLLSDGGKFAGVISKAF